MKLKSTPPAARPRPAAGGGRAAASRERLTFNYGGGTVPGRGIAEAAIATEAQPSFATAPFAEPRDWGYFGLLAFTAVLLLRPQDQVPGLNALHLAELCAIVGIGPMLLHRFARRLPVFRVTPETLALIGFGFVIIGTAPFSIWPGGAVSVFMDAYIKVLIVFVLMMNTLTTPKRLEQITWLILVCCGYIAARAVFDYARGVNLIEGSRLAGPVGGIFGNPNDLAMNMVTFMPAAVIIALTPRYSVSRRLTAAVIAALMLATVVFTKSRSGGMGLAFMLAALIVLGRKVRPGFGTIAIVVLLISTPFMPSSFWTRMSSIFDEQQDKTQFTGSREARRILMQEGIDTFVEHPFTGVGAGQFKNYNPAGRQERWKETHNSLLQVASETGVFGLVIFSFLIFRAGLAAATTRRLLTRPRKRPDALASILSDGERQSLYGHTVGMSAGLIGWFVCSLFASVAYTWTFYYVLALIVAGRELTRYRLSAALRMVPKKPFEVPSPRVPRRRTAGAA
jgi:O-antigen ligase